MNRLRAGGALAALCAGAMLPAAATASVVLSLDTPALVDRAEHVVVADVVAATAAWDERHERIVTTIDLAVVERWKGPMQPAGRMRVVQAGGTVGDMTMVVVGAARLVPGERALLFLRGSATAARLVGLAQGKRRVRREVAGDRGTDRWMVDAPNTAGMALVRRSPSAATPAAPTAVPLDDLRTQVRALAAGAGAVQP